MKKKVFIGFLAILIYVITFANISYADPTDRENYINPTTNNSTIGEANDYIDVYKNNSEILTTNDVFTSALREGEWLVTKGLVKLTNASESLYNTSFSLIDFTQYKVVQDFINSFKPLILALLALSICYIGYFYIIRRDKKLPIISNIVLLFAVMLISNMVFSQLNSFTNDFYNVVKESPKSATYQIINNSLVDLIDVDNKTKGLENANFKNRDKGSIDYFHSGVTKDNFDYIDYNEVLNYDSSVYSYKGKTSTILKHKLITTGANKFTTAQVGNGIGWNSDDDDDFLNEFYYRYTYEFITGTIQILALLLIYICLAYKVIRIIFELVTSQLLIYLYSTEIAGGERTRKILEFIFNNYILLMFTVVSVKIYNLLNGYIMENVTSTLTQSLLILFVAFSVIDGPNIIQQLIGIDAGLKSSTARFMAAYGFAKGASRSIFRGGKGAFNAGRFTNRKFSSIKNDQNSNFRENANLGSINANDVNDKNGNSNINNGNNSNLENGNFRSSDNNSNYTNAGDNRGFDNLNSQSENKGIYKGAENDKSNNLSRKEFNNGSKENTNLKENRGKTNNQTSNNGFMSGNTNFKEKTFNNQNTNRRYNNVFTRNVNNTNKRNKKE